MTFDSDTHTLQSLNDDHLAGFSASGMTKLYGTMNGQFAEVLKGHVNYRSVAVSLL